MSVSNIADLFREDGNKDDLNYTYIITDVEMARGSFKAENSIYNHSSVCRDMLARLDFWRTRL